MIDLKKFRTDNKLSQEELASFLGVSIPFISQIENAKRDLPEHQLSKLMLNMNGWDVSALKIRDGNLDGDFIEQNGGTGNIGKITGDNVELLCLRKENEMLRKQVEDLTRINEKYWGAIVDLMKK